jgi:DNA topoisomerase-1
VSRKVANDVLREVAARLGNTLAVCRKAYVHPGLMAAAAEAGLTDFADSHLKRWRGLTSAECRLRGFLAKERVSKRRVSNQPGAKKAGPNREPGPPGPRRSASGGHG